MSCVLRPDAVGHPGVSALLKPMVVWVVERTAVFFSLITCEYFLIIIIILVISLSS